MPSIISFVYVLLENDLVLLIKLLVKVHLEFCISHLFTTNTFPTYPTAFLFNYMALVHKVFNFLVHIK